jgi:hypothetical protein
MEAVDQGRVTLVLRPHVGFKLQELQRYARLGAPVSVGRALGVIASLSQDDAVERAEQSEAQLVLAESALKRATTPSGDDHHPALRRVIQHIPTLYLQVADEIKQQALDDGDDEIKQQALDDGDDEAMASEAAGQAIRVLVTFKQRLEKLLEPDLLTTEKTSVVAESMHIDDRVKAVAAEPSFLTMVFKLPTLGDAATLIARLPYGQKALGTQAEVFGLTTGNLMEAHGEQV